MDRKKWSILFIVCFMVSVVTIGITVFIVDPYFHYHEPLEGMSYSLSKEAYVNDGISKNFPYNGMITGTSMTKGFRVEEANKIFDKEFIRITFQGEGFKRINDNLTMAIEQNPELDFVIRGVDTLWFISGKDWMGYDEYPDYLYDDNIWNDVNYLFNKDIWIEDIIPQLYRTIRGEESDHFDNYGNGGPRASKEDAILKYDRQEAQVLPIKEEETQLYFFYLEENLEQNILQVVKDNPDITFYLFFPPYSICWWDSLNRNGVEVLKRRIDMEKYAIEMILQHDNVKLFSFFTDYETICDLTNYFDEAHYTDNICTLILERMKAGEYELTKENYRDYIREITEFYCNYDYDSIFEE